MTLRVLLTGAGSPAGASFLEALDSPDVEVFAADADRYAPGLFLVPSERRCILPPADEPSYIAELFGLALRHRVDLIVPGSAAELPALDYAREPFEAAGLKFALASTRQIALASDRLALYRSVEGVVMTPRTWTRDDLWAQAPPLPLRVISRDGVWDDISGVVLSRAELDALPLEGELLQEILVGAEVVVDLVMGRDSSMHALVPREIVRGSQGLGFTERTLHHPRVQAAAARVAARVGALPCASLRFMLDGRGEPYLLDMDVLPSSSAVLLREAGVDSAHMLVLAALGLDVPRQAPAPFAELGAVRTLSPHIVPARDIQAAEREPWQPLGQSSQARLLH